MSQTQPLGSIRGAAANLTVVVSISEFRFMYSLRHVFLEASIHQVTSRIAMNVDRSRNEQEGLGFL
jgi:hypothetical protein